MPRTPAKSGVERRQQLLEAALAVFAERGFEAAGYPACDQLAAYYASDRGRPCARGTTQWPGRTALSGHAVGVFDPTAVCVPGRPGRPWEAASGEHGPGCGLDDQNHALGHWGPQSGHSGTGTPLGAGAG